MYSIYKSAMKNHKNTSLNKDWHTVASISVLNFVNKKL